MSAMKKGWVTARCFEPVAGAVLLSCLLVAGPVVAQTGNARNDATDDSATARYDALFATPGRTPVPQDNIFATAPGVEQQARRSQFTFNILAPFNYNSNAEAANTGGTQTAEFSPRINAAWSTPVFDLPLRFSANLFAESDRYTQPAAYDANFDKLGGSARLQYIDPENDQAYSPYISYAPRMDFDPTFGPWFATRQDLNIGFNKRFNFDGNFQRVPFSANSRDATVWAFGLTTFLQQRFRYPTPSSHAFYVIPSVSYLISENWNASLGVEVLRRGFQSVGSFAREDVLLEPIFTLEYVMPEAWFGSARTATLLGRPALDFQVSYENNWSNLPAATYNIWRVGVVLKAGWNF
jgi:hypothetical protein